MIFMSFPDHEICGTKFPDFPGGPGTWKPLYPLPDQLVIREQDSNAVRDRPLCRADPRGDDLPVPRH